MRSAVRRRTGSAAVCAVRERRRRQMKQERARAVVALSRASVSGVPRGARGFGEARRPLMAAGEYGGEEEKPIEARRCSAAIHARACKSL